MPTEPSREADDRIDLYRAQDEPADSWTPVTPSYGPGLGMEVVPTDLAHFAEMLAADQEAFDQSQRDADNERGIWFPNFAGFPVSGIADLAGSPGGAMAEGMAFQRTYLDSYIAVQTLLGEATAGLVSVQAAAQSIHAEYLQADGFGLGPGGNAFSEESGYHARLVNSVFNPEEGMLVARDEARADLAEAGWSEALRGADATEAGVTGVPAILIGDADPRPSGEHALAADQDGVASSGAADDYAASATDDATELDDITLSRPDPSDGSRASE